jgi:hypothetical protein
VCATLCGTFLPKMDFSCCKLNDTNKAQVVTIWADTQRRAAAEAPISWGTTTKVEQSTPQAPGAGEASPLRESVDPSQISRSGVPSVEADESRERQLPHLRFFTFACTVDYEVRCSLTDLVFTRFKDLLPGAQKVRECNK